MLKPALIVLIILFFLSPESIPAQSEKENIIKTVQLFFDAMSARDTIAARNVLLADGQFFSIRDDTSKINIRKRAHRDFITNLTKSNTQLLEIMHDPQVLIHNRIAIVWTPYKFYLDGKYSHGGVDAFSLLKTASGWKIAGIIYTIE